MNTLDELWDALLDAFYDNVEGEPGETHWSSESREIGRKIRFDTSFGPFQLTLERTDLSDTEKRWFGGPR